MTVRDLIKKTSYHVRVLVLDEIGTIKADGRAIDLVENDGLMLREVDVVGVSENILIIRTAKEKAK